MVKNKITITDLKFVLIAGAVWGVSEVIMGAWLQGCAMRYSGAIMTGLAFFHLSFTWTATRRLISLLLLLTMVILFKMFNAVLLSLPVTHGSVLNPSFAFLMQTLGFLLIIGLFRQLFFGKPVFRVAAGASAALISVMLFPFAGIFTGSAACLAAGTQIPLSVYTSPVAMSIAMITVPLGYLAANKLKTADGIRPITETTAINVYWPAYVFVICVALVVINSAI
jgi:hypothetical protein